MPVEPETGGGEEHGLVRVRRSASDGERCQGPVAHFSGSSPSLVGLSMTSFVPPIAGESHALCWTWALAVPSAIPCVSTISRSSSSAFAGLGRSFSYMYPICLACLMACSVVFLPRRWRQLSN